MVFTSKDSLIKAIVKATYLFDFDVEEFGFTDGAIQTSDLVDEESIKADKHDIELWKKGEKHYILLICGCLWNVFQINMK